jgi:O-antigen ligase
VLVTVVLGGGSRADVLSLFFLRPLSIAFLAIALHAWGAAGFRRARWLVGLAALIVVLAVIHVVPLPPAVWTSLPARDLVAATYRDIGAPLPWLPLTLSPAMGWNALFSLTTPMAALLLALQCGQSDHRRIVNVWIGCCAASGLLGLLQVAGPPGGPLYFYRITNDNAAVGLFANRNANALFLGCAFPLLALFWNSTTTAPGALRFRRVLLLAAAFMILLMLLLTGSRSGLLAAAIAVAGSICIAWRSRGPAPTAPSIPRRGDELSRRTGIIVLIIVSVAVCALVLVTGLRSEAFARLLETDPSQEARVQALYPILEAVSRFWPWGSGAGSFDSTYRMFEPEAMLGPQYLNHAHDDWLETVMTYGLPGAILLVMAVALYLIALGRLLRRNSRDRHGEALGWAGATIIAMLAAQSLFDYPLRVPTLAVLGAVAAAWLALAVSARPNQAR